MCGQISLYRYVSNLQTIFLIINGQSSMMGLDFIFHLLAPVPKKPINFDRRQVVSSFLTNLFPQFLHSNNGAGPNLQLFWAAKWNHFMPIDSLGETRRVTQNSNVTKDLRNSIIGEHRQFMNVMKEVGMRCIFLSSICSPNICDKNLRSLVEVNETSFVNTRVSKTCCAQTSNR